MGLSTSSSESAIKKALDERHLITRYHRDTLVAIMACAKRRSLTKDWAQVMEAMLHLLHSKDRLMMWSNFYQELCGRLCLRGLWGSVHSTRLSRSVEPTDSLEVERSSCRGVPPCFRPKVRSEPSRKARPHSSWLAEA